MSEIKFLPGTPDDDNRTYLPRSIIGSDIVVNENGNNSHPYPANLKEYHETLEDGYEGTWFEYVPDSYDGSKPVPMVMSFHGGLMNGWGQCIYSSWTMAADRDGFIVVFPTGHYAGNFWQTLMSKGSFNFPKGVKLDGFELPVATETIEENYDIQFIIRLMKHIQKKYNIDTSRVFTQGMSNGSAMATIMATQLGYSITGSVRSAGFGISDAELGENGELITPGGPTAFWMVHPELNSGEIPDAAAIEYGRKDRWYWLLVNGNDPAPRIYIEGENNLAFFDGGKAPTVLFDIKNRDHGQALDEAFIYWDYMFSGAVRNGDGTVTVGKTNASREGDANAFAFAEDVDKMMIGSSAAPAFGKPFRWAKLKYHGLNGGTKVRGEYTMVPARALAQAVGAVYEVSSDSLTAKIGLKDGRTLKIARGSILCQIDEVMRSMHCETILRDEELYVPLEWFSQFVLNRMISQCNGVIYVTDHYTELSSHMAALIVDVMNDCVLPKDAAKQILG